MHKDIVVIGASTGGIETLKLLVSALPPDLPSSLFIVLHTGPASPNILDLILSRAGSLPAKNARDWDEVKPGHIYVAPSDHHLVLDPAGYVRLTRGPRENRFRPAVDVLFRSAAHAYGRRVVGVVLSGWLDDGTAGLWAIKERGGTTIVQDPREAVAAEMPANALAHVEVDYCQPVAAIARTLVQLSATRVVEEKGDVTMPNLMDTEVKIANEVNALETDLTDLALPSIFACPECHGVLLSIKEGSNLRFRCHTGHAYSLETLLAEFTDQNEETLWGAIRSLEETVILLRRMADNLDRHEHGESADALRSKANQTQARANIVRQAAQRNVSVKADAVAESAGDEG